MNARILSLLLIAASCACSSQAWASSANLAIPVTSASTSTFTALHTYYMSPTGSDSANGLTPATAWATPNHAVVCGDVIIAAAGAYGTSTLTNSFGAVANCPSSTGGIDGAGGIYFATLLCGGTYVGACNINNPCSTSNNPGQGAEMNQNNWAIEGWAISSSYATNCSGFPFTVNTSHQFGEQTTTSVLHHIAWINDIAYDAAAGFTTLSWGANSGIGYGVDYWAMVGDIAQNAAGRNDGFWTPRSISSV